MDQGEVETQGSWLGITKSQRLPSAPEAKKFQKFEQRNRFYPTPPPHNAVDTELREPGAAHPPGAIALLLH